MQLPGTLQATEPTAPGSSGLRRSLYCRLWRHEFERPARVVNRGNSATGPEEFNPDRLCR